VKALVFRHGEPRVVERPDPDPPGDEAVVRVHLAGICGTDVEIARGYMAFEGIPGHEFVGVVERSADPSLAGRRVVGEINASCGACPTCRAGRPRHCPRRTVLGIAGRDGAFAERLALPERNLHVVPDGVSDRAAVFTEPMAAACAIAEEIAGLAGSRAAVVGDGRLARLSARVLAGEGAPPEIWGKHPEKLARFERDGLRTHRGAPGDDRAFDLVVEASGSPDGLELALRLVRPCGTVVLKSTYHGAAPIAMVPVVIDEIRVVGSRCGPFAPALARIAEEPAFFEALVSDVLPLDDAREAFRRASSPDASKVLFDLRA
jgi:threonine dehydrogenase-like Zn-dependent dehydrogenase